MPRESATAAPSPLRTFAPTRRIIGREIHGNRVVDHLECGHMADRPYTGFQISRRCEQCLPIEALHA